MLSSLSVSRVETLFGSHPVPSGALASGGKVLREDGSVDPEGRGGVSRARMSAEFSRYT